MLNTLAYADLIPVIDGGIALTTFTDGRLRSGIWRSHTLVPERPCLVCIGQLDLGDLSLDRHGLLDDPSYIAGTPRSEPSRQNVATLSASVSAALLAQFVSLLAHPGGRGVPAPVRYLLASHQLDYSPAVAGEFCPYESETATGDNRPMMTEAQEEWRQIVKHRQARRRPLVLRLIAVIEWALHRWVQRLT